MEKPISEIPGLVEQARAVQDVLSVMDNINFLAVKAKCANAVDFDDSELHEKLEYAIEFCLRYDRAPVLAFLEHVQASAAKENEILHEKLKTLIK